MKTVIHKAETRGNANHGWLNSYHTFSFANYHNPERMNFGVLRVLNDDTVQAGMGFGTHPHQNMEIRGYMDGSLLGYDDPSNTQINAMTDVDVYYSNSTIGELILQLGSNDDDKVYIIYTDGTSEDVETYYDPFITNIELILF